MRHLRFTIAGLTGAVLMAAVGLSALRNASATWAGVMFLVTYGVLGLAIVGAVCRGFPERAWWLGFFVFGWGYLSLVAYWSTWFPFDPYQLETFPTSMVLSAIRPTFGPAIEAGVQTREGLIANQCYSRIGHDLWALLAALLGGILARVLFGHPATGSAGGRATDARRDRAAVPDVVADADDRRPGGPGAGLFDRRDPIRVGRGVLVRRDVPADLGTARARRRSARSSTGAGDGSPGWARPSSVGATWSWRSPGSRIGRSRPTSSSTPSAGGRLASTGAVAPRTPASSRRWNSRSRCGSPTRSRWTTCWRTSSRPHRRRPIPASRSTSSGSPRTEVRCQPQLARRIDLEGVPLKTTLRLCLKQLGCGYSVQDGVSADRTRRGHLGGAASPFRVAGHCLLALIAAGFGLLAGLLVSAARTPSAGRE